jgi:hypothetical protein
VRGTVRASSVFRNKWVAVVANMLLANLMERNGTETGASERGGGGLAAMEWSVIPNPNHGAWPGHSLLLAGCISLRPGLGSHPEALHYTYGHV